jgi:hypothetical protein
MSSAEAAFDTLAEALVGEPDVERGTGFGTMPGLRVGGKIFAMLFEGALVVKLPPDRVGGLVKGSGAERFTIGERRMREWVAVQPSAGEDWTALASEALAFVRR